MTEFAPVPSRTIQDVVGTFLIGTWLNAAVFAFELTQVYRYFKLYPIVWQRANTSTALGGRRPEHAWIPIMISWMVASDAVCLVALCLGAYTWSISGWGNPAMLQAAGYVLPIYGITTAICIFTLHIFLISRYYILSPQMLHCAIFMCLALVAFSVLITCAIMTSDPARRGVDTKLLGKLVITWFVFTVATDWLIAGALTWRLMGLRTSTGRPDPRGIIPRLIRLSILSGSVPAILAVICMALYLISPNTNYLMITSESMSNACTLTALFNLNSRRAIRGSTVDTSPGDIPLGVVYLDGEAGQASTGSYSGVRASGGSTVEPLRSATWNGRDAGARSSPGAAELDSKSGANLGSRSGRGNPLVGFARTNMTVSAPAHLQTAADSRRESRWG